DRVGLVGAAGCVDAEAIAEPRHDPRLVDRRPPADAVAEPRRHHGGVLAERLGGRARRPAAAVLERLREVPVVERHERLDAVAAPQTKSAGKWGPRVAGSARGAVVRCICLTGQDTTLPVKPTRRDCPVAGEKLVGEERAERITIRDIAERAGVSKGAVSYAL